MEMKSRKYWAIKIAICLLAVFVLSASVMAVADDKCGTVTKLTRTVMVTRGGHENEIQEGDPLYQGDIIRTGEIGYAEIKLIDDTLIAIGNNGAVSLTDVQFNVNKSQLSMSIDHGAIWVSTGSIGLINSEAVKFTTPSAIVSSGNATLQFSVGNGSEELTVQWIPKGGKVSVYNTRSKTRAELKEADKTFIMSGPNAMTVKSDDIAEEPAVKQ
ncbi:MAG: hypothetical protein LBU26_07025 [Synergistaceae bacterium]|jgi:hypothetical protein|nr:hypothetical protein [Synergistaceae bacterium]